MPFDGAIKPLKCGDEVIEYISKWDIGATGAHTKTSGFPGRGFTSVARTAAGKYTVTFADVLPAGGLITLEVTRENAADAAPSTLKAVVSGYTASARTALYENWSVGTTPAQLELVNGDKVVIRASFLKTK